MTPQPIMGIAADPDDVRGASRAKAITASKKALEAFQVGGVKTTIPVHRKILAEPDFRKGRYDTTWLERLLEGTP